MAFDKGIPGPSVFEVARQLTTIIPELFRKRTVIENEQRHIEIRERWAETGLEEEKDD